MKNFKNYLENIFLIIIIFHFSFQIFFSFEYKINSINNENFTNKEPTQKLELHLSKGLLERYLFMKKIYDQIYTTYIDNELVPKRLFQVLSQEIKKDLVKTFLYTSLIILILFYFIAQYYKVSFYLPFRTLIFITIIIFMFVEYFFILKEETTRLFFLHANYIVFIKSFINSFFLLGSTFLLFRKKESDEVRSFLNFYFSTKYNLYSNLITYTKIILHFVIVSAIAIIIVNIFLFPIYYFQIKFNLPFHYIFLTLILFLVFFYVRSYYRVSHSRNENPNIIISLSFLIFRIIQNFFLAMIFIIFTIIITQIILGLTLSNIKILEYQNWIPKNTTL